MRLDRVYAPDKRQRTNASCHIILCGNEKGGSGKSTSAIHISVALIKLGFKVAVIDLDIRQQTLSRHIENRHRFIKSTGNKIETPELFSIDTGDIADQDRVTFLEGDFVSLPLDAIRAEFDFVIIDTPGSYTRLSVLAHRVADTLVTPINDSFIDFDVLARIDGETFEIEQLSQYALEVRDARRFRQNEGHGILDWVVVRNRMSQISSRNEQRVDACMRDLSGKLGFRIAHGIGERVIFREYFQSGLTALDVGSKGDGDGGRASISHIAARTEVRRLIAALHLPIDDAGRKRAEMRNVWLNTKKRELALPDIFA